MTQRKKKHQKPQHVEEALKRFASVDPQDLQQEMAQDAQGDQRVRLVQPGENGHPLLIYNAARGIKVELPYQRQTLWATQQQMSDMFGINVPSVSRHLKSIFEEGELDPAATV